MPQNHDREPARTAEELRLGEAPERWRQWGPYLSERQWGTVREDYSENGNAWNYFTHDQARSRAYHWGEDGLAGISDDQQRLCFSLALWNGKDPILKERLFGLTNSEGNHGEDVKEYYFYLDSTPTHSYMKYLYKYPQNRISLQRPRSSTNRQRSRGELEYELLDTGVFNEDRYFDVFVEYAKAGPSDILIQISVCNRGPETGCAARAADTVVPQHLDMVAGAAETVAARHHGGKRRRVVAASDAELGEYFLLLRGNAAPAVHRKRDQQRADLRHAQRDALCQGWDQQLRGGRQGRMRSTRTRQGPRPPPTTSSRWREARPP